MITTMTRALELRVIEAIVEHGTRQLSACQNCNWVGPTDDVQEIHRYSERVQPDEEEPAGECPECGCLAHEVRIPHA